MFRGNQQAEVAIPGFQGALKVFSIAQVMHLIQLAMRSLTSVHQRGGIASSRLGTVFADSLSYFSHRAKLEKWTIKKVNRPIELPISVIASLFAQEVTRLDEEYATRTPSTNALREAMTCIRTIH
jgi:hypothetical protein